MTDEVWRLVVHPGVRAGAYAVSSMGLVRNAARQTILKPMRTGPKRTSGQRSKVRLATNPIVDIDVAVLVLTAFVGPRPEGAVVMHGDDDSTNNRLSNLSWGSPKNNAQDAAAKGRTGGQKLTAAQVAEIRRLRADGVPGAVVAEQFGVSQQRVCDVFKGRTSL